MKTKKKTYSDKVKNKLNPTSIKPIRIDCGCGKNKRKDGDWIGVDVIAFEGVDIVMDLGKNKWPWKDGSVDEVHASHFVEHLKPEERIHFVNELYRVLKDPKYVDGKRVEGFATIIVPHWASQRAYGDLTHCFSEDTEILTENGWKSISKVNIGEKVLSLDLKTEESHFEEVIGVINEPYIGPMLHFESECLDLKVTPNHDMVWRAKTNSSPGYYKRKEIPHPRPILRKSQADTFEKMGGHHPRCGTAVINWKGEFHEKIRIADDELSLGRVLNAEYKSEDFAEFMGWFIAEGHVDLSSNNHYRITIAQSSSANPHKVEQIKNLLDRMGFTYKVYPDRIRFDSKPLALYLKKLGLSHEKFIPNEIKSLSPNLLRIFLDSAIKGDGRTNSSNGWEYATVSLRLADDIQEVALKAGYRTSLRKDRVAGTSGGVVNGHEVISQHDLYMVGIYQNTDLWYPKPKRIEYSGKMVCVTLANHNNIFVRRNGKPIWSGNCWPPVSEFWFYYLDKDWRAINAPHNDKYTCHFGCNWWYNMKEEIQSRNTEYQTNAALYWKEACSDTIATFEKKPLTK